MRLLGPAEHHVGEVALRGVQVREAHRLLPLLPAGLRVRGQSLSVLFRCGPPLAHGPDPLQPLLGDQGALEISDRRPFEEVLHGVERVPLALGGSVGAVQGLGIFGQRHLHLLQAGPAHAPFGIGASDLGAPPPLLQL